MDLRNLLDCSLDDLRGHSEAPATRKLISLANFIAESKISASLAAANCKCELAVADVDAKLAIDADQALLFSAVGTLLHNAFKVTPHHARVSLSAYAVGDRIHIDVEDSCGGLAAGAADPEDSGLSMCRRSVQANNGFLSARDVPGSGCVFTIDLPRHALPVSV